jgi:uncharacterized membrane protein YfcA
MGFSMLESFLYCLSFGGLAGLVAGLFGIGGGIILVPFFLWLFIANGFSQDVVMHSAVATSLATIIVTAISSVFAHHRLGSVLWDVVYKLAPGVFIGAVTGAALADRLPTEILKLIFACYLLIVSLEMAFQWRPKAEKQHPSSPVLFVSGVVIGALSSILGIGGGTLTVPLLSKYGFPIRNAVAVSSACGLPIAMSGSMSFALLGVGKTGLPEGSIGYVYWPAFLGIVLTSILMAPMGAKLAHQLPTQTLKRIFAGLLFIVAVNMFS